MNLDKQFEETELRRLYFSKFSSCTQGFLPPAL